MSQEIVEGIANLEKAKKALKLALIDCHEVTPKTAEIIYLRFALAKTFDEIAKITNLSRQQIEKEIETIVNTPFLVQ